MDAEVLTNEQLTLKLTELLQTGPLYRELVYTQAHGSLLPENLRLFCPGCGTEQTWRTPRIQPPQVNSDLRGVGIKTYSCANCNKCQVHYCFCWQQRDKGIFSFQKIGQHPPLEEKVVPELEKALGKDDAKLYKRALRLRNFSFGVGAVSYMRRIVENHMNEILDTLYATAVAHKAEDAVLSELEEAKKSYRFDDKVSYASRLLPAHLRPDGLPNPLDILHDLFSDGLHARSEEECVDIFDRCRITFEYVFASLRPQMQKEKVFKENLVELSKLRVTRSKASAASAAGDQNVPTSAVSADSAKSAVTENQ